MKRSLRSGFLVLAGIAVVAIGLSISTTSSPIEVAGISSDARELVEVENFKDMATEPQEVADEAVEATTVAAAPEEFLTGYEIEVLNQINNIRVSNGLGPLSANAHLSAIADSRSQDMLSRDYFSHYTPEGTNIFNILQANGVTYRNAGENLAHSRPADIGSVSAFMNAWMNSPGHRANILRGAYGQIGIGEVSNGSRRVVTTVFMNG
jgi:uncharacterized protein YkwD